MEYLSSGKILVVDLGSGEVMDLELEEDMLKQLIGGAGVNNYLLKKYEGQDPIVLGTGILTGSICPGSSLGVLSRVHPNTQKPCHIPLALGIAVEMKYSGYDYLVLLGSSNSRVYLWVHDGIADIQSADGIWGKDTWATTDILRKELGDPLIQTIVIGPAGEALSPYAGICVNYWNMDDPFGLGSLFGKKNLKAIAFRGMGLFEISEPEGFLELSSQILKDWKGRYLDIPQGITGIFGLMGREDLSSWLSPIVHRHRASFNNPFAANTFVFIDEDPGLQKESELESPGMLLTGHLAPMLLKEKGLGPKESASFIREAARSGLDPVALLEAGLTSPTLAGLPAQRAFKEGIFGDRLKGFRPGKLKDMENAQYLSWYERRMSLSLCLGLDPLFMLLADFLETDTLLELLRLGTGIEIEKATLEKAVNSILS